MPDSNNKIIKDFKKCPICHHKETVCQVACVDEASIPTGTFVSLEKKITPIQDFTRISTPTVKVLIRHYDTCSECGLDYCTRVESTVMPTDALMRMMGLSSGKGGLPPFGARR